MVCILMLYGHLGCNLEAMAEALRENHGFQITRFPTLELADLQSEESIAAAKEQIVQKSAELIKKCLHDWNKKQVVFPVYFEEQLIVLRKKIYMHLVRVEVPTLLRFQNFKHATGELDLESFIRLDDLAAFKTDLTGFHTRTAFSVAFSSEADLLAAASKDQQLRNVLEGSYRISNDVYFMKIALISKTRSNCMKRAIGCVIVKNNRIISIGYNGTPYSMRNCFEGGCERCNDCAPEGQALDTCICLHAEESAILEVGSPEAAGATLYTTTFPCFWCAKVIIQCVS